MADPDRWMTSNSAYGSFWHASRAVPLQPKVLERLPAVGISQAADAHYQALARLLRRLGLRERPVRGDGNCQFRALADQLYGSEEHHATIREQVVQQLQVRAERYCGFVPGSFKGYLAEMARDGTWGDHVTLQVGSWCTYTWKV
mmetsp:Transcript_30332/g.70546  ORF Transcript_30332/g.70546 Transcript_30332/m.70546 type:complete len:144 (-) Transcript_30332:132-563(-)